MRKNNSALKIALMLFFLISIVNVYSQSTKISFTASVSKSEVLFGNVIKLEFELKNVKGEFEAPTFENFEIVSGPNTSSSMYIVNGESSSTKKITYYLKPKKEGKLNIEPAYLVNEENKDSNMETKPINIVVKPNPSGIIEEDPEENIGAHFFSFPDIRSDADFLRQQWGGNTPEKIQQEKIEQEKPKPRRKIKRF
jgi:hypothetical protein